MLQARTTLSALAPLAAVAGLALGLGCGEEPDPIPAAPAPVVAKEIAEEVAGEVPDEVPPEVAEEIPGEVVEEAVERTVGDAADEVVEEILEIRVAMELLEKLGHHALDIEVDARGHEILLSGEVDLPEVRPAAEALTKGVDGVTSVENEIVEEQAGPAARALVEVTAELQRERQDALVELGVTLLLVQELGGDAGDLAVVAEDGTVTLIGSVDDQAQHQRVLELVRSVEDVEQVVDELSYGP